MLTRAVTRLKQSASWLAISSGALLYLGLHLLRLQIAADLELDFSQALQAGIANGWSYDAGVVALAGAVAVLAGSVAGISAAWIWVPGATLIYTATVANVLHFRFFRLRLDWWVVELHWRDMFTVQDSARELGATWRVVASLLLFVAAVLCAVSAARAPRRAKPRPFEAWTPAPLRRRALGGLALAAPLATLTLVGMRLPHWSASFRHTGMVLSDQILRVWFYEGTHTGSTPGATTHWIGKLPEGELMEAPSRVLAQLRDCCGAEDVAAGAGPDAAAAGTATPRPDADAAAGSDLVRTTQADRHQIDADWPLLQQFQPEPAVTRALRRMLGLPAEGPVHVVVLFIESLRAFELEHPELGPQVFPRLRRRVAERGIHFSQAYSSSFAAGETVRGEFSTLCSMLPNVLGAATYVAHTTTRVHCIQALLAASGYRTLWANSYSAAFHSKKPFEMLHGTQHFFDVEYFRAQGITKKVGGWGLADDLVLQQTARLLQEQAALASEPLFAAVTTTSSHHPHTVVPEGPLPESLLAATAEHPEYQGYLSRMAYADRAAGDFLDTLFAGPLGDRTLVVMLGDHSIRARPHLELSPVQKTELLFRIPILLFTRDLPQPRTVATQVHQADVAPTLGRITGAAGPVSWVGRGLFAAAGTPWVYLQSGRLHYRSGDLACYTLHAGTRCFDLAGRDPLFDAELAPAAEDPALTGFFHQVLYANLQAIALDRLLPPAGAHASSTKRSSGLPEQRTEAAR